MTDNDTTVIPAPSILLAAENYAQSGLHVFPCHLATADGKCSCGKADCSSPGKHPLTKNGLLDATTDLETIRAWWKRWPAANIAIATGTISGFGVIDVDPRHGGDETFKSLNRQRHGGLSRLEPGLRVLTGGGGLHIYFKLPTDTTIKSRNNWRPGVDLKCEGGYVIAPPSNHVAGTYRWKDEKRNAICLPPVWLDAITAEDKAAPAPRPAPTDGRDLLLQRAQQYVAAAPGAVEGGRNQAAFNLAGHLAALQTDTGDRLGESDILTTMAGWNVRCNPPLADTELRSCVSSSLKNGKPRAIKEIKVSAASKSGGTADESGEKERVSTADKLVELALKRYHIGRTETDDAFAVELDGPNLAIMFRGSRDALRSALSRAYRGAHGRTPNATAIADALTTLQGEAYAAEPEPVNLRVAEHNGDIVIDLGDSLGRAVVVRTDGWQVVDRSPVLFRRTAATGALPMPERGGSLDELRRQLNVSAETWPLVIGWQVAALVPNMPHPILMLGGQQGTGKTSGAKKLISVVDPSPADLRSQPRDPETWAISASASWVVGVDNVSRISEWWSDSLCKAVTGDGWLRRKLYTDGDLAVLSFRRVILLTSIDAGALRGDLGDRVLLVDLEPIDENNRRAERDIDREFDAARPRIFGALLDLLVRVWKELPHVQVDRLPRMADFGRLLAALDVVTSDDNDDLCSQALKIYIGQKERIADSVIESDAVALAIQDLIEKAGSWSGTAAELLVRITPDKPPKGWPRTPQSIGGRLKRLLPALALAGIKIEFGRTGRKRTVCFTREDAHEVVTVVTSSLTAENSAICDGEVVTTSDGGDEQAHSLVTSEHAVSPAKDGNGDNGDGCDKHLQPISSGHEWSDV